jgi:hypothetical protein
MYFIFATFRIHFVLLHHFYPEYGDCGTASTYDAVSILVSIEQEAGCAPEPVWMLWRRESQKHMEKSILSQDDFKLLIWKSVGYKAPEIQKQ